MEGREEKGNPRERGKKKKEKERRKQGNLEESTSLLAEYCKKLSLFVIWVLFKVIWKIEEREWILATVLPKF